jgi:signal transduction histidine kinase/ActR/RegA family two-component response regulator
LRVRLLALSAVTPLALLSMLVLWAAPQPWLRACGGAGLGLAGALVVVAVSRGAPRGAAERRRREAEVAVDLARTINGSLDLDTVLQRVVESVRTLTGCDGARIALVDAARDVMVLRYSTGAPTVMQPGFAIERGKGIGGLAWALNAPVRTDDIATDPRLQAHYRDIIAADRLVACLVVPIRIGDRIEGLVYANNVTRRPFTEDDESTLLRLAEHAAVAIRNATLLEQARAARDVAETARQRSAFLAEAGGIVASSLDYDTTLGAIAELAVRRLADWCAVDLVEEDGGIRRLALAHADPRRAGDAAVLRRAYPPVRDALLGVARVLRTGRADLAPQITDEMLRGAAWDDAHLAVLRRLGLVSGMVVPLNARGTILGALSLFSAESGRVYGADDLALAEDLARRAALAVDNARLYGTSEARRRQAEAMMEIGQALNRRLDPDAVARRIADSVRSLLGTSSAVVYRTLPDTGEAVALAVAGDLGPGFTGTFRLPADVGTIGLALRERRPVVTPDLLADERIMLPPAVRAAVDRAPHRAVLAVPLMVEHRPIGALMVGDRAGRVFDGEAIRLGQAFADQAAVALQNAQLYHDARAANRAKDEFLAVLSHELRTPLTAILGWARILRAGAADAERTARGLETIERNTRLQKQLIDDLLDVSRIISGKLQLDLRAVDLAALVEESVEPLQREAVSRGIALTVHLDRSVGRVFADAGRLQQVVVNLVSNALKFTPRGGRVDVELQGTGSEVVVRVDDTGQGIAAAALPHIFDHFRQADSTVTRGHGGLGLGLAIVRHLVELHGGTVQALSAGPGSGASFVVRLPLLRASELAVKRAPARVADEALRLGGRRVLVVDDHADSRELIRLVLHQAGADVHLAASAGEALAVLDTTDLDLVISDLSMPEADGYELIRRMRQRPGGTGLPAIALSAYASAADRQRALEAGFDAHAAKPIDPVELIDLVSQVAARAAAR